MSKQKREIKVHKEYGKSRCDVKKKKWLRPRCKIAVKNLHKTNTEYEKICLCNIANIYWSIKEILRVFKKVTSAGLHYLLNILVK